MARLFLHFVFLLAATAAHAAPPILTIAVPAQTRAVPGFGEPVFGPVKSTIEVKTVPASHAGGGNFVTTIKRSYTRAGKLAQVFEETEYTDGAGKKSIMDWHQTNHTWQGNLTVSSTFSGSSKAPEDYGKKITGSVSYTYDSTGCLVRWARTSSSLNDKPYAEMYKCQKTQDGWQRSGPHGTQTFDSLGRMVRGSNTKLGFSLDTGISDAKPSTFVTRCDYKPNGDDLGGGWRVTCWTAADGEREYVASVFYIEKTGFVWGEAVGPRDRPWRTQRPSDSDEYGNWTKLVISQASGKGESEPIGNRVRTLEYWH